MGVVVLDLVRRFDGLYPGCDLNLISQCLRLALHLLSTKIKGGNGCVLANMWSLPVFLPFPVSFLFRFICF